MRDCPSAAARNPENDRRDAGEAGHLALDHAQRDARCDPGIDGAARDVEDGVDNPRCKETAAQDDMARTLKLWTR